MKVRKHVLIVFLITVFLFNFTACGNNVESSPSPPADNFNAELQMPVAAELPAEDEPLSEVTQRLLNDANELIDTLEANHIMFAKQRAFGEQVVPNEYYLEKEKLLSAINNDMFYDEFFIRASMLLATLNDAHTAMNSKNDRMLTVSWRYADGELTVTDGDLPKGAVIRAIGGKDINEIIEFTRKFRGSENESARELNIERYSRMQRVLKFLGCEIVSYSTDVSYELNGITETMSVKFRPESIYPNRTNGHRMQEGVFIFQLGTCSIDENWQNAVDAMVKYVESGGETVVIDVRDNGGGNSQACTGILDALNMRYGSYGGFIGITENTYAAYGADESDIGEIIKYDSRYVIGKSKINLFVLTNRQTFSSATMMGVWVQDAKLGKLVGEISSNAPNSYGDVLSFKLDYTGLTVTFSWKQWIRPDESASPDELIPDYITKPDEDALDAVFKLLADGA